MNINKLIFTVSILLFMSGCIQTPSIKPPSIKSSHKPTTKELIYDACVQSGVYAKSDDPEMAAVFSRLQCSGAANICAETPTGDTCPSDLKEFELELNKQGVSLLFGAAYFGDYRLVEAMITAGVNIDYSHIRTGGWTPLMIAVAEENEEVVSLLIKSDANVNAKNKLGRTSLMFASTYGFYSIAKMLLENNANTDEIPNDKTGWTAIISAAYEGHYDIVSLLISHGADTNIQNKNGKTALMMAENQGHTKIVELLKATH